jgi:hypothetical protein
VHRFGLLGLFFWIIAFLFCTIYTGEYMERLETDQSIWKAGVWIIECWTGIFALGAGFSVLLYFIYHCIRPDVVKAVSKVIKSPNAKTDEMLEIV